MGRPRLRARTTPSRGDLLGEIDRRQEQVEALEGAIREANQRIGTLVDRLNNCGDLHRLVNLALRTWPYRAAGHIARALRIQPALPEGYDQPMPKGAEEKPTP